MTTIGLLFFILFLIIFFAISGLKTYIAQWANKILTEQRESEERILDAIADAKSKIQLDVYKHSDEYREYVRKLESDFY